MTTVQLTTSRKIKVQNVRAKLHSLKNLAKGDEDSLLAIQKSLQKHNTIDDPETTAQQFSKREEDDIIIEDRLWHYFQNKSKQYEDKIQKEKVNGWHRIVKTILNETEKKIKANEANIQQMQSMIQGKYKQTHSLFKQIQSIKIEKSLQKGGSRRKRSNIQTSRGEKMNIIQQNIMGLKQEIQSRSSENQKIKIQLKRLKEERASFLVNVVKAGYYLNDGIKLFLEKMVQINYVPTLKTFPDFLDVKSKEFLIQQYEQMSKKYEEEKQQSYRAEASRTRAKSHNQLADLTKQEHFKDIYNGTKDYLLKLLLKEDWKKQETKLPKIGFKNNDDFIEKRRQMQRKRIKIAYPQELRQRVKKIQFGIKLDTILP